jgi:hypothetical protein
MLDLSHWYKKNYGVPFDLRGFQSVEHELVELHKRFEAVCYVEMGSFLQLRVDDPQVTVDSWTDSQGAFHTRITTPIGTLEEERPFDRESYSYPIRKHLIESVEDFSIVCYFMDQLGAEPKWQLYRQWEDSLGEYGYPYMQLPYSGLGYLISRNFGVENTIYASVDYPDQVKSLVDSVNAANLRILDAVIDGPFETLFISDNYDSTVQTEELFNTYSRAYYTEVARRLHDRGKFLAVHVDGEMRGALERMASCGVDCIDAATPAPMFALTPAQAREEAGSDLILSGGIPATAFGETGSDRDFEGAVRNWLATRHSSARLILAAGDQVPPDAPLHRIQQLPELVRRYGRY